MAGEAINEIYVGPYNRWASAFEWASSVYPELTGNHFWAPFHHLVLQCCSKLRWKQISEQLLNKFTRKKNTGNNWIIHCKPRSGSYWLTVSVIHIITICSNALKHQKRISCLSPVMALADSSRKGSVESFGRVLVKPRYVNPNSALGLTQEHSTISTAGVFRINIDAEGSLWRAILILLFVSELNYPKTIKKWYLWI